MIFDFGVASEVLAAPRLPGQLGSAPTPPLPAPARVHDLLHSREGGLGCHVK